MADTSDAVRDAIHAAIQEHAVKELDKPAVLVGWAMVCDWSDSDGERWLSRGYSSSLPVWFAEALFREGLEWNERGDDDDER